jgi:transposase
MHTLMVALWIAGAIQLAIALANFVLPKILNYEENLARVAPIIRQIFLVHSAYIVGIVLLFAAITFGFAADLASGHGLGRFLAAAIAVFWFCRVPLQIFYYDPALRRANRAGDAAMTLALLFLAVTYAAAALAPAF